MARREVDGGARKRADDNSLNSRTFVYARDERGLTARDTRAAVARALDGCQPRRALLIPPDFTRLHANAGTLTRQFYHALARRGCAVDILPALGMHAPMTPAQTRRMFGDIPPERFLAHSPREGLRDLGEIPGDLLSALTGGLWDAPIRAQISRRVMDEGYGLIVSIGQVVPHEVAGLSNHAKNLFVGVGGADMISKTHMIGALCGMESAMGRDHAPVRRIFDYALARFLPHRPLLFALTVCAPFDGASRTRGLFISPDRACLDAAARLSRALNITLVDSPLRKCAAYLPPHEYRSAWLCNKAIYRARMAMADGGELLILAPGMTRFGEDDTADALIRRYGYCGQRRVLDALRDGESPGNPLREHLGVAAHLIHGSTEGRFRVTYATRRMTAAQLAQVGYGALDYAAACRRYPPDRLRPGVNTLPDGEEIYFIPNPALGLWCAREAFDQGTEELPPLAVNDVAADGGKRCRASRA